jgi:hypothetical protein
MSTRTRSASREAIIRKSDTVPSGEVLDPHALLADVLPHLHSTQAPLTVKLTDGSETVSYMLDIFLSKDYECINNKVKFGYRVLLLSTLRVSVEYNLGLGIQ